MGRGYFSNLWLKQPYAAVNVKHCKKGTGLPPFQFTISE